MARATEGSLFLCARVSTACRSAALCSRALGAYRWYMAVESRTASTTALPRHITIVESRAALTGIDAVEMEGETMSNVTIRNKPT